MSTTARSQAPRPRQPVLTLATARSSARVRERAPDSVVGISTLLRCRTLRVLARWAARSHRSGRAGRPNHGLATDEGQQEPKPEPPSLDHRHIGHVDRHPSSRVTGTPRAFAIFTNV